MVNKKAPPLFKSHYYGNVRVLEIMARWEQLDCLWHNNPTLSISSASSLSLSLYCILPTLPFSIPHSFSPWLTSLADRKAVFLFFFPQDTCLQRRYFIIKFKHYCMRAFAAATFQQCLRDCLSSVSVYLLYCWKLYCIRLQSVAVQPGCYLWHEEFRVG